MDFGRLVALLSLDNDSVTRVRGEWCSHKQLGVALLLTLILAVVGIVVSFPLGVFLALCRQSNLPAIRWVSTAYIEMVRGVPLITILFMGNILIPIFMPGLDINQVLRMALAITFFSAAYMAENVRGGLQGIPRGQHEAAQAVGT